MANPNINFPQLASGYLNNENNPATSIGKTATGSPVNMPAQAYAGMLGKIITVDDAEAARLSKTGTGFSTLRAGAYMCVITKAASSVAPARGIPAFWDSSANNGVGNYVVTPDITAPLVGHFCGIYLNAPTKGNQCWIQIGGLATGLCKTSSVTSNVIGDLAIITSGTVGTFDAIADASDALATALAYKLVVGTWYEAPVADAYKLLWLKKVARFA